MNIDITIVAGRRPDLLARTLESFSQNAFKFHNVIKVYANIDPIFGTTEDHEKCVKLLNTYFDAPVIYAPEVAGFGAAVKRLWQATTSDYVFHLEDDWMALDALDGRVESCFSDKVKQVSFHSASQNWDINKRGHLHRGKHYWRFAGIRLPLGTFTKFTTSPSVLDGTIARSSAALMDPAFDPEKQFYSNVNKKLEDHIAPFENYIFSPAGIPVVEDTGRDWRDKRGIQKKIINAASSWVSE